MNEGVDSRDVQLQMLREDVRNPHTHKNTYTSVTSHSICLTQFPASVISLRYIRGSVEELFTRETIARCRSFTPLSPVFQIITIHEHHKGVIQPPL